MVLSEHKAGPNARNPRLCRPQTLKRAELEVPESPPLQHDFGGWENYETVATHRGKHRDVEIFTELDGADQCQCDSALVGSLPKMSTGLWREYDVHKKTATCMHGTNPKPLNPKA